MTRSPNDPPPTLLLGFRPFLSRADALGGAYKAVDRRTGKARKFTGGRWRTVGKAKGKR